MDREPKIEERPQQPYAGIAAEVDSEAEFRQAVDRSVPELFGWLGSRGIEPAGPPFIRYLELSEDGQPLRFEFCAPTAEAPAAEGRVRAGTLPAGSYLTYLHVGPYTHAEVDDLNDAHSRLIAWAEREGLDFESSTTPRGTAYEANVERYLTDASREPDWSKWQTELACLITSA
jgi:effector-binding domain-containing protein